MLAAVLFYSVLFLALVVLPALLILVFLLFADHERRLWRRIGPSVVPALTRFREHPSVRNLRSKYPRTISFIGRRFDPHDPWGLPATTAAIVILAGLWFLAGIIQDVVGKDPLVLLDVRLHNSVPLFRSSPMTWLMLSLTNVGSPGVLWVVCIGAALIALSRNNRRLAATYVLAIAAANFLSMTLKATIGFARPTDAIVAAHERSFPSGHLLASALVYGLFASRLLSSRAGRITRAAGTALLLLLIGGISVSRLYLGVHWPSDLLGSLAIALVCLALLLFFLHYERPLRLIDDVTIPLTPQVLRIGGIAFLVASAVAAAFLVRRTRMVVVGPPPPSHPIAISSWLGGLPKDIPRRSEGLIGEPMEPVSIVIVGSKQQVVDLFRRGGWTLADLPTPIRVVKESLAALANHPDASGPATPAYLADRPQTLTFEKPDPSSPGVRRRHHTRVWQTAYCATPGCQPIWVATASFDIGVELSPTLHLPTHRIDPNIDAERALIVRDLTAAGARPIGMMTIVAPFRGKNAAGDPFATDGRAAIVTAGSTSSAVLRGSPDRWPSVRNREDDRDTVCVRRALPGEG